MTWTKLSDDFSDDCWTLSDKAFRLHVEGLVWNNRKLVDLHLSKDDVRRFAKHPDAVAELLAVGWWSEQGDGYVINHHATYQRSRDDVLRQQTANQENGRKGGRPPKVTRERTKPATSSSETHSLSQSVSESVPPYVPSGPDDPWAPAPRDAVSRVAETQSLSESKSERDGTGLASGLEALPNTEADDPWSTPVAVPGQSARARKSSSSECMACVWSSGVHDSTCEVAA